MVNVFPDIARIREGGWEAGGGLNPPTGLFGVAMCPRSASHRPRQD